MHELAQVPCMHMATGTAFWTPAGYIDWQLVEHA
jgi:hypothetical protein